MEVVSIFSISPERPKTTWSARREVMSSRDLIARSQASVTAGRSEIAPAEMAPAGRSAWARERSSSEAGVLRLFTTRAKSALIEDVPRSRAKMVSPEVFIRRL